MIKSGFIGVGNMGSALARAVSKKVKESEILIANRSQEKLKALEDELNCYIGTNSDVGANAKFIFLGVKPQGMAELLSELAPVLKNRVGDFILVTMAAGIEISRIRELVGEAYPVIRIMPNTPCATGDGVVLTCRSDNVTDDDYDEFKDMISGAGLVLDLPEGKIDAGSAISGCGPAFVYMFIEAMADAGVACGLTRAEAQKLAMHTVKGSAELAISSGKHTAELRDNVCSPGGSTIEGVLSLENDGFRGAVANCVRAAFERTRELGK